MPAFKNLRLPLRISYGSSGGPGFRTDIVETAGGKEYRNQAWEYERAEYECRYDATLSNGEDNVAADGTIAIDYRMMLTFFRIMGGMAYSFRARDWLHYRCRNGLGFFVDSDGSPTLKQMVIRETIGGYTVDTPVTKPISGKITTDATGLDYNTGLATSGTTWYGDFDKHVRFNTDKIRPAIINQNQSRGFIVAWQPLPLIELRVGEVA
jgi:uncharacterized protein (TIGR02217 family)